MSSPYAALILAGGGGTRLWPLSRPDRPKPYIPDFPGPGPSLLAQTVDRLSGVIDDQHIFIVANPSHEAALRRALPGWDPNQIIFEPAAKNTAAAIAYGLTWVEKHRGIMPQWAVLPADHCIASPERFGPTLRRALTCANQSNEIVTLGIPARSPSSQFGYIQIRPSADPQVFDGLGFTEKPDRAQAKAWIDQGDHVWNAGIFIGTHRVLTQAFVDHCPELWNSIQAAVKDPTRAKQHFAALDSQPFDRAIMEKLHRFKLVALDAGWNDVGQWQRAAQELNADPQGNAISGATAQDTLVIDGRNCKVFNQGQQVAIIGAQDLCVVVDQGRVLVVAKGHEHKVAQASAHFVSPRDEATSDLEPPSE